MQAQAHEQEKAGEVLRFLYEQRLNLFNVRREHEWKILFGGIAFLGAIDASMLTGHLLLTPQQKVAWVIACIVVFTCLVRYEVDLQSRNLLDRKAMNLLYNKLCDALGLDLDSEIREAESHLLNREWFNRRGWAFKWQILFLSIVTATSAYIPWIKVNS